MMRNGEKTEMNNKFTKYSDAVLMAIGEAAVAVVITLVYTAIGLFKLPVLFGAVLGGIVTVINFLILSHAVNKALNKFISLRGDGEMSEEESAQFAKKHSVAVQAAVAKSYLFRTGLMVGSLVLAFITGWFDPIATVIPLLLYKPLLYAIEFIKRKRGE